MGARLEIAQQTTTISIPREQFLNKVVMNRQLGRKDMIVLMFLLTELDGWNRYERHIKSNNTPDPCNFKKIHKGTVAETLGLKKEDVGRALSTLMEEKIIERGSSSSVRDGFRFTF